ncbi:hypothetical protein J6590_004280 [Homalodisca vitripennis]|nr:hypothetical protein J6590_004280 [Homalodisca vitripennis]
MIVEASVLVAASVPLFLLTVMTYFDSGLQQSFPIRSCEHCDCEGSQTANFRSMFRPRGALARALYNKQLMDCQLEQMDHTKVQQSIVLYCYVATGKGIVLKYHYGKCFERSFHHRSYPAPS